MTTGHDRLHVLRLTSEVSILRFCFTETVVDNHSGTRPQIGEHMKHRSRHSPLYRHRLLPAPQSISDVLKNGECWYRPYRDSESLGSVTPQTHGQGGDRSRRNTVSAPGTRHLGVGCHGVHCQLTTSLTRVTSNHRTDLSFSYTPRLHPGLGSRGPRVRSEEGDVVRRRLWYS